MYLLLKNAGWLVDRIMAYGGAITVERTWRSKDVINKKSKPE
jgi:hypothetical protein